MAFPTVLAAGDMGASLIGAYGCGFGGALYQWTCSFSNGSPVGTDGKLHLTKSTDAGNTWTELDAAHAPVAKPVAGQPAYTVAQDGDVVQFLWIRSHGPGVARVLDGLTRCTFDLTTGLWGAPVNISAGDMDWYDHGSSDNLALYLIRRATNDLILLYSSTRSGGFGRVSYALYNGTVVSGAVFLGNQSAGQGYVPLAAAYDADTGLLQFIIRQGTYSPQNDLYSIGVDSVGTIGAAVLITTLSPDQFSVSEMQLWNPGLHRYAFAMLKRHAAFSSTYDVVVYQTDDTSTLDATWSLTVLRSGDPSVDQLMPAYYNFGVQIARGLALGVTADLSMLAVSWSCWQYDEATQPWGVVGVTTKPDFSFNVPALLFNVPAPDNTNAAYQCAMWTAGTTVGLTQISITQNFNQTHSAQFWPFLEPIPLTLAISPIPAELGEPYSLQAHASGGTAPYTFTASGLPDGVTINAGSGLISGTPAGVPGFYLITVTVTDSAAASVSVTFVLEVLIPVGSILPNRIPVATTLLAQWLDNTGALSPPYPF